MWCIHLGLCLSYSLQGVQGWTPTVFTPALKAIHCRCMDVACAVSSAPPDEAVAIAQTFESAGFVLRDPPHLLLIRLAAQRRRHMQHPRTCCLQRITFEAVVEAVDVQPAALHARPCRE